ncbi:MAG TPA: hypothetical protein VMI75_21275 [Polyangiaceae bacterium]|nr:hypothetical protein [Polyangiaceae bacterium]
MPHVIRVRDVVREGVYDFGPDEPVLRGPYELFNPVGPVRQRGALVDFLQGNVIQSARVAPTTLGECHPGERVLMRLVPLTAEDEWWLCEVESVDGVAAA